MAKSRPRTGEARVTNQPFKIDRLPVMVRESIELLYNHVGKTWEQIEALSAEPFDPHWAIFFQDDAPDEDGKKRKDGKIIPRGGFVDWQSLDLAVLELFPDMRIPHSTLQRWYDVRVRQVQANVMHRAGQAREIAIAFSKAVVKKDDEAVINAARDTLMGILSEDGSSGGRQNAAKGLIRLADVMQKAKTVRLNERKVNVAEQALQIKLDEIKHRTEALLSAAGKGDGAAVPMTREELMGHVRGIYGLT